MRGPIYTKEDNPTLRAARVRGQRVLDLRDDGRWHDMSSEAGKGDGDRTTDHDAYRRNYDRIFGSGCRGDGTQDVVGLEAAIELDKEIVGAAGPFMSADEAEEFLDGLKETSGERYCRLRHERLKEIRLRQEIRKAELSMSRFLRTEVEMTARHVRRMEDLSLNPPRGCSGADIPTQFGDGDK